MMQCWACLAVPCFVFSSSWCTLKWWDCRNLEGSFDASGRRSWTCGGNGRGATPQLQGAEMKTSLGSLSHDVFFSVMLDSTVRRQDIEMLPAEGTHFLGNLSWNHSDFLWFLVMFLVPRPWQVNSRRPGWSFFQWLIDSVTWKHQDESDCVARELISKSGARFCAAWTWSNVDSLTGNIANDVEQCNVTYTSHIHIMYSMYCLCMFIVWWKGVVGIYDLEDVRFGDSCEWSA